MARFTFSWEEQDCGKCGQPLQVRLTRQRTVFSVAHGKFVAIERQGHCPHHPHLPPARSRKLPRIVAPGCKMSYDVIARVGLARFLECRQCEEIQIELSRQYGIEIPVRTISKLSQDFVAYVQVVHQQSIKLLRTAMQQRGGYVLHIDGTCEDGSRVLFVCFDSLRVKSWKAAKSARKTRKKSSRCCAKYAVTGVVHWPSFTIYASR